MLIKDPIHLLFHFQKQAQKKIRHSGMPDTCYNSVKGVEK